MNTIEKFIIDLSKKGVKSHCYLILQLLVQPDGSLISAKGLEYDGPDLNYQSAGIVLLSAIYEPFTLGTILILRQQKDWVGRVRKWPILMMCSNVFMLT